MANQMRPVVYSKGMTLYSAKGNQCTIVQIASDKIVVDEIIESIVWWDDNRKSEKQVHFQRESFNLSDYGKRFFSSRADYEYYLKEQRPTVEYRPPQASVLTESLYKQLIEKYQNKIESKQEEIDYLKIVRSHTRTAEPYIGRMDFAVDYRGDEFYEKIYIGEQDIIIFGQPLVYSWKNPVAGYYNQMKEQNWIYSREGHTYGYNLLLRRRFEYPSHEPIHYQNLFIAGQTAYDGITDEFLQKLLRQKSYDQTFTNIIRSIQAEQDKIIRAPLDVNLIVQGCAGSGKTMILLHRISQLMYNHRNLTSEKIRIITPSKSYNFKVLYLTKDLEIDQVPLLPIHEFYRELLQRYGVKSNEILHAQLKDERHLPTDFIGFLYSLENYQELRKCYDDWFKDHLSRYNHIIMNQIGIKFQIQPPEESPLKNDANHIDRYQVYLRQLTHKNQEMQDQIQKMAEDLKIREGALRKFDADNQAIAVLINQFQAIDLYLETVYQRDYLHLEYEDRKEQFSCALSQLEELRLVLQKRLNGLSKEDHRERLEILSELIKLESKAVDLTGPDYNGEDTTALPLMNIWSQLQSAQRQVEQLQMLYGFTSEAAAREYLTQKDKFAKEINQYTQERTKRLAEIEQRRMSLQSLEQQALSPDQSRLLMAASNIQAPATDELIQAVATSYRKLLFEKHKPSVNADGLFSFDLYLYLTICLLHFGALPRGKQEMLINIDEAQDHAAIEYRLLSEVMPETTWNIYGDTNQLIWPNRGIDHWQKIPWFNAKIEVLNENYRNSQEITDFANQIIGLQSRPVGPSATKVELIKVDQFDSLLEKIRPTSEYTQAIILKDAATYHQLRQIGHFLEEQYRFVDSVDQIYIEQNQKVDIYTIALAKGLEFRKVIVYGERMTPQEQYIATTRAMTELIFVGTINQASQRETDVPSQPPITSTSKPIPRNEGPGQGDRAKPGPRSFIEAEQNIADLLREKGFKVIDNRSKGGNLWVLYDERRTALLNSLLNSEYIPHLKTNGALATNKRPAWWIERRK